MDQNSSAARKSLCVFVGVHILMCILYSCFLPTGNPWNVIFLGTEFAFAAAAAVCCAVSLVRSGRSAGIGPALAPLRSELSRTGYILAAVWCVCSFIASFLAIGAGLGGLYHNSRYLFYLAVSLLVCFPLGAVLGREDRRAFLHLLYDLCLLCFCLFLLYGFYRFFRGDFSFKALFGRVYRLKKIRVRLGLNTNTTGCYAAFFLVMGVYRMAALKKPWQKALLILALIPVYAGYAMSESRSSVLSAALAVGFLVGAAVYRRRGKKSLASILLSVAAGAAAAAAFVGVFYGTRKLLNLMQQKVIQAHSAKIPEKTKDPAALVKTDDTELGGRRDLWISVLAHVFKTPELLIHGCTQSSTPTIVEELTGRIYNTHNQLLEVLLAYGLPSLTLFLAWLVLAAGKSLSVSFDPDADGGRWMLPSVLLLLVINNMAETMLVARGHFVGGFFFLIAGYVCGMAPKKKKPDGAAQKSSGA